MNCLVQCMIKRIISWLSHEDALLGVEKTSAQFIILFIIYLINIIIFNFSICKCIRTYMTNSSSGQFFLNFAHSKLIMSLVDYNEKKKGIPVLVVRNSLMKKVYTVPKFSIHVYWIYHTKSLL